MSKSAWAATPVAAITALLSASVNASAATLPDEATVFTLEGGIVGMQHLLHFTPDQLRGDLCRSPYACRQVDYFALPVGRETQRGGELLPR